MDKKAKKWNDRIIKRHLVREGVYKSEDEVSQELVEYINKEKKRSHRLGSLRL